jgi:hypothetical protein
MKTFFAAGLGFLPLILFWALMGTGRPNVAVAVALAVAVVASGSRLWSSIVKPPESAILAFLAFLGLGHIAGRTWAMDHAVTASFVGLGLYSLASTALRKPWTADYARDAYADVSQTPEFLIVNQTITDFMGAKAHCPAS